MCLKIKKITFLFMAAAMLLSLSACGEAVFSNDINEDTNGFDVTAKKAKETTVKGYITIGEGECLKIAPSINRGFLILRMYPDNHVMLKENELSLTEYPNSLLTLYEKIRDSEVLYFDIKPGDYLYSVTAEEKATTGTVSVFPCPLEEMEKYNEDLRSEEEKNNKSDGVEFLFKVPFLEPLLNREDHTNKQEKEAILNTIKNDKLETTVSEDFSDSN